MLIPFPELFARHGIKDVDGIVHLGGSSGQEAETYQQLGIKSVIWVEALPDVFTSLYGHIQKFSGHTALLACVSDTDGELVQFKVANNGGQSSSFLEFGTHAQDHPTTKFVKTIPMRTCRVDTLLRSRGLDRRITGNWLLNADLQGAELKAIRGMGNLLNRFRWAYIEVNQKEVYLGCPLVGEIDAYLAEFGFKRVETKMTGAGWGDALFVKENHGKD